MKKTIIKVLALALVAVMMCAALVSCGGPNADPDKARTALKDNGYAAEKLDSDASLYLFKIAGIDDLSCVVTGTAKKDDKVEHITIFYFEDTEAANEQWEDVQKYSDKSEDKEESDWVVEKSGKMIYYGTKQAVKDAQ